MATWPSLIKPTRPVLRFTLQNPTRTGGLSINGFEQVIYSNAERWRARGNFKIRGAAAAREFEKFLTDMGGRSGTVNVPTYSGRFANWPVENDMILTPWLVRNRMLDGTAYEDDAVPAASAISAELAADVSLGDVTCSVRITQGSAVRFGQLFSIGARLYRAVSVTTPVSGVQTLTFRPKTRLAASSGDTVVFDRPVCTMRFATDDEGLEFDGWDGVFSLNFVENL